MLRRKASRDRQRETSGEIVCVSQGLSYLLLAFCASVSPENPQLSSDLLSTLNQLTVLESRNTRVTHGFAGDCSPAVRSGWSSLSTLIVICVVTCLGVLALSGTGVPFRASILRNAGTTLQFDLERVRRVAIQEKRSVRMTFDLDSNRYACNSVPHQIGSPETLRVDLSQQFDPALRMQTSFDPVAGISFDPKGQPHFTSTAGEPSMEGVIHLAMPNARLAIHVGAGLSQIEVRDVD